MNLIQITILCTTVGKNPLEEKGVALIVNKRGQNAVKIKVAQSCPTLCDLTDYTVHRILQARILEWVTVPFSR